MSDSSFAVNSALRSVQAEMAAVGSMIRQVSRQVGEVDGRVGQVDMRVQEIGSEQRSMHQNLISLVERFEEFERRDALSKALNLAETQLVRVRQELQTRFGHYAEVRRLATGILQGVDAGLVGADTLRSVTEEVMISTPGYWLAPVLVSLAGWLRDRKETAQRALQEALKRDDYKTTLFFTLVMRRMDRREATMRWLERFFLHQDPRDLDRAAVVVLEAITSGSFPVQARQLMEREVGKWIELLLADAELVESQVERWKTFCEDQVPDDDPQDVDSFAAICANYQDWRTSFNQSNAYAPVREHLEAVASVPDPAQDPIQELDRILDGLCSNYDDEELPYHLKERRCQLVIEHDGDEEEADEEMEEVEGTYDERQNFLDMLSNAMFDAEAMELSPATRAMAFAISRDWADAGIRTFHEERILAVPGQAELAIDDWRSSTADGSDDGAQVDSLRRHVESRRDAELALLKFSVRKMIPPPVLLGGTLFLGFTQGWTSWMTLVVGAFFAFSLVPLWKDISAIRSARKAVRTRYSQLLKDRTALLQHGLSQFVVVRRGILSRESELEPTLAVLAGLDTSSYRSSGAKRNVVA